MILLGLNHTNTRKIEPLVWTRDVPTLNHAAVLFFLKQTVQLGASITIIRWFSGFCLGNKFWEGEVSLTVDVVKMPHTF